MQIVLNGQKVEVPDGTTVHRLAERFQLNPKALLAERNGEALHRTDWTELTLQAGDRIELIRVVAGG